jgi:uncharacterized membrane protein
MGMDHTRIEGLSDGVFAIAIALLLISGFVYWLYLIAVPIYSTIQASNRKKILETYN